MMFVLFDQDLPPTHPQPLATTPLLSISLVCLLDATYKNILLFKSSWQSAAGWSWGKCMAIVNGRDRKLFWPLLGFAEGSRKLAASKTFTVHSPDCQKLTVWELIAMNISRRKRVLVFLFSFLIDFEILAWPFALSHSPESWILDTWLKREAQDSVFPFSPPISCLCFYLGTNVQTIRVQRWSKLCSA